MIRNVSVCEQRKKWTENRDFCLQKNTYMFVFMKKQNVKENYPRNFFYSLHKYVEWIKHWEEMLGKVNPYPLINNLSK